MRRWFRAIWRALHDGPDVVTWVGHWMVGLGAALIGASIGWLVLQDVAASAVMAAVVHEPVHWFYERREGRDLEFHRAAGHDMRAAQRDGLGDIWPSRIIRAAVWIAVIGSVT